MFPERTSGIIFFENMMGIFFTGRDLTEEVLAETEAGRTGRRCLNRTMRQRWARPQLQFPGFAAVFA